MDFDLSQLRVIEGKGKKDRYVPPSEHLIRGLKSYIEVEKPIKWLFKRTTFQKFKIGDSFWVDRYTIKIAISNRRIKAIVENTVTFTYKDYKSGAVKKQMTLTHEEFIRRLRCTFYLSVL